MSPQFYTDMSDHSNSFDAIITLHIGSYLMDDEHVNFHCVTNEWPQ